MARFSPSKDLKMVEMLDNGKEAKGVHTAADVSRRPAMEAV